MALLLDTLHDELMAARFDCDMKCSAAAVLHGHGQAPLLFKANSSLEMNAAESAQMDDEDAAVGSESGVKVAGDAAPATSAVAAAPGATLVTSEDDRTSARESESASPKSFDSHSSIGKIHNSSLSV